MIRRYEGAAQAQLCGLLKEDVCTFSMLARILKGPCAKIVTDHERVIMCLSARPFPVWVWTAPDASRQELERVWETLKSEFPPQQGHSYNVALPLARVMMNGDSSLRITVRLMAYHCRQLSSPRRTPGGGMDAVREEETGLAAAWYRAMHKECALNEEIPAEAAREAVGGYMRRGSMFFWRDESGAPAAMCGVDEEENSAYITHVYTPAEKRRRGYAGNLVHAAARAQLEKGKTPMLYTDADYAASNACYTQIGFALQGELCTLAR